MSDKLRNLLRLLDTALMRLEGALAQPVNEFVRDSAIQRFEFTLGEYFCRMLKKTVQQGRSE